MARYKTPDAQTLTLPGIPARRGRPATGKAMTNAERMRKYRKNKKAAIIVTRYDNSVEV